MNKTIKAKWLKALRSGDYKQTRRTLRDCSDKYCCLGVLYDVCTNGMQWKFTNSHWEIDGGNGVALGDNFRHECEITQPDHQHLMKMNDSLRADFNEIANYIEETM